MELKRFFKKEFVVGLDIGSSAVKLAQFTEDEAGLHLKKTSLKEISPSASAEIQEQEIIFALQELCAGLDLSKAKVIVSLNCPQTDVRKMTAPYMPKEELREGIKLVAKKYFPFSVEESFLDFEILGDVMESGVKKLEVAVAASPKTTVYKYLELLHKAGIRPAALVPAAYALKKAAVQASLSQKESRTVCFIDIGKAQTELVILKGQYLEFSRKLPVCADDFTKALTQVLASDRGRLELTFAEAEKIKKEAGIPSAGEARIIDNKISPAQIKSMLMTPLERLNEEIVRCFDYFREKSRGARIESVVLFGGGASLAGLAGSLSETLGLEVRLGEAPRFELAAGAALSRAEGVNLLPPEVKEAAKIILKRGAFEGAAVAIALIAFLIYIGMRIELSSLNKKIGAASIELSSLQQEIKNSKQAFY
jgi:type IV pilus assembly protein PilM